jgi:predicted dehydrogenase
MDGHEPVPLPFGGRLRMQANKTTAAFIGTRHPHIWHRIALLQAMPDVEVLGFFDDDPDIAAAMETKTGFQRFAALQDLISLRPELCIVESMDMQTADFARAAAPYAKALLLEKVTAPSLTQLESLAADLRKYPIHIEHGFQLHYLGIVDRCKQILESGALGQVTLARFHGGSPAGCSTEIWCNNPQMRGGLVWIEGGHMLEIMLHTLGTPESVQGLAVKLPEGQTLTSKLVISDLFAGAGNPPMQVQVGTMIHEDVGAGLALYRDKLAIVDFTAWESGDWCSGWRMEYYGTNGTLVACPVPSWLTLQIASDCGGYKAGEHRVEFPAVTENGDSQGKDAYRRQLRYVLEVIRDPSMPRLDGMETILNVARMAAHIYETGDRGKPFR